MNNQDRSLIFLSLSDYLENDKHELINSISYNGLKLIHLKMVNPKTIFLDVLLDEFKNEKCYNHVINLLLNRTAIAFVLEGENAIEMGNSFSKKYGFPILDKECEIKNFVYSSKNNKISKLDIDLFFSKDNYL